MRLLRSVLMRSRIVLAIGFTLVLGSNPYKSLAHGVQTNAPQKRRVAVRARLCGTKQYQQVVTWATQHPRPKVHLAIQSSGPKSSLLFQAEDDPYSTSIESIQVADLDGDGIPEILSLWSRGQLPGGVLRVFHWKQAAGKFIELPVNTAEGFTPLLARDYVIEGTGSQKHLSVNQMMVDLTRGSRVKLDLELRDDRITDVEGGPTVNQSESGIEGQALLSPTHPGPIRVGQPHTQAAPFQTDLAIYSASDGREVARAQTGTDGRFRVSLPPGIYLIGPPRTNQRKLPRAQEQQVEVTSRTFSYVTIQFDSGMR